MRKEQGEWTSNNNSSAQIRPARRSFKRKYYFIFIFYMRNEIKYKQSSIYTWLVCCFMLFLLVIYFFYRFSFKLLLLLMLMLLVLLMHLQMQDLFYTIKIKSSCAYLIQKRNKKKIKF